MKKLFLSVAVAFATFSNAQVTIGTTVKPIEGALLDLKQHTPDSNNVTSSLGMSLPRVKLTNKTALYPMFDSDTEYLNNKESIDSQHTGLLVYNTNNCQPLRKGLFVWNGTQWISLQSNSHDGVGITIIGANNFNSQSIIDTLYIPTGKDNRTIELLTFGAKSDSENITLTAKPINGTIVNNSAENLFSPKLWTSGKQVITQINAVYNNITPNTLDDSNSFDGRVWDLDYSFIDDDCGTISKQLIIHQKNYKIEPKLTDLFINKASLGGSRIEIPIKSNVPFEVTTATTNTDTNSITTDVIASYETGIAGSYNDNIIGEQYNSGIFSFVLGDGEFTPRYKTVTLTLEDKKRSWAKPVKINVTYCLGSGIGGIGNINNIIESSTTETETGSSSWSGKVVHHPQKAAADGSIIYHDFYSAEFGDAGRWMTTNLSAKSYDTQAVVAGTINKVFEGPKLSNGTEMSAKAYWNYSPTLNNTKDYKDDKDWKANPYIGLQYTWTTVTGGNYWGTVKDEHGKLDTKVILQGICPNGWHVPSDNEWFVLETEILKNKSAYSQNIDPGYEYSALKENATDTPPIAFIVSETWTPEYYDKRYWIDYAKLLMDPCPILGDDIMKSGNMGYSNSPAHNGFATFPTGLFFSNKGQTQETGSSDYVGIRAPFWTSSSFNAIDSGNATAICRSYTNILRGANTVSDANRIKQVGYRSYLGQFWSMSVRCKKN